MNDNYQKSKVTVIGKGNEITVNQVNVTVYTNDILSITSSIEGEIRDVLEKELVNSELNVFLCYPNNNYDESISLCIANLKSALSNINAIIYEGGGKEKLPHVESAYPHISELDFIKRKCDSVIIFVLDELTLSQITLISYYKVTKKVNSSDLIVIFNDEIKGMDDFFSLGVFQYCDDNDIKIFNIKDIHEQDFGKIITRVRNKKLISKDKGILGG